MTKEILGIYFVFLFTATFPYLCALRPNNTFVDPLSKTLRQMANISALFSLQAEHWQYDNNVPINLLFLCDSIGRQGMQPFLNIINWKAFMPDTGRLTQRVWMWVTYCVTWMGKKCTFLSRDLVILKQRPKEKQSLWASMQCVPWDACFRGESARAHCSDARGSKMRCNLVLRWN